MNEDKLDIVGGDIKEDEVNHIPTRVEIRPADFTNLLGPPRNTYIECDVSPPTSIESQRVRFNYHQWAIRHWTHSHYADNGDEHGVYTIFRFWMPVQDEPLFNIIIGPALMWAARSDGFINKFVGELNKYKLPFELKAEMSGMGPNIEMIMTHGQLHVNDNTNTYNLTEYKLDIPQIVYSMIDNLIHSLISELMEVEGE